METSAYEQEDGTYKCGNGTNFPVFHGDLRVMWFRYICALAPYIICWTEPLVAILNGYLSRTVGNAVLDLIPSSV